MKNGKGASKDTAETARNALYHLHRMYATRAGAILLHGRSASPLKINGHSNGNSNGSKNGHLEGDLEDEFICEISPLLSYDGEGIRGLVDGNKFKSPLILLSEDERAVAMEESLKNGITVNGCKIKTVVNGCSNPVTNGVH